LDRILVIAALRKDRLIPALRQFLDHQAPRIGHKVLNPRQRPHLPVKAAALLLTPDASPPPGFVDKVAEAKAAAAAAASAAQASARPITDAGPVEEDEDAFAGSEKKWSTTYMALECSFLPPQPVLMCFTDDESVWDVRRALNEAVKEANAVAVGGKGQEAAMAAASNFNYSGRNEFTEVHPPVTIVLFDTCPPLEGL
jgi:hypothetical protein